MSGVISVHTVSITTTDQKHLMMKCCLYKAMTHYHKQTCSPCVDNYIIYTKTCCSPSAKNVNKTFI